MKRNDIKRMEMLNMRNEGYRYREIAEKFGCSQQYVSSVCGKHNPARFVPVDNACVYPNLRAWMNRNKISKTEFLRRMGFVTGGRNNGQITKVLNGLAYPRKDYIDKMMEVTGMDYETMFSKEFTWNPRN